MRITARDTVSLDGEGKDGSNSAAFSSVEQGIGQGGNVEISTGSLFLTSGAQLVASTFAKGNAGNVRITARDTVSLDGVGGDGTPSAAASSLEPGGIGQGGNVEVTTGSLSLTNGAQLIASTSGEGNSGSILVQADETVSLEKYAAIFSTVEAGAKGNGGIINIQAGSLSLTDVAQLLTSVRGAAETLPAGQGNAGNVIINVQDAVKIAGINSEVYPSGIFSKVETGAKGKGGNITLKAESLAVIDRAQLSADSEGSGAAGNLDIKANSIGLDNQAALSSDTISGQGNIIIDSENLVLRRGSNITTNSKGTATGGNITINTGVMAALENSDISANADEASGGQVRISAQGIFGTEFRNQPTPESDITATSNLGPQFSGTVQINTSDVDPSQGLVALPEEVVDVSGLIAQDCPAGEGPTASRFVVTGRGGLPPNPEEALSSDAVVTGLVTLDSDAQNRSGAVSAKPSKDSPATLVSAKGWVVNDKGEVTLTAQAPTHCHSPHSLDNSN